MAQNLVVMIFCLLVASSQGQSNITNSIWNSAQTLNVPENPMWSQLLSAAPYTTGVSGYKQIQPADVDKLTSSWDLRSSTLKQDVMAGVRLMVYAADSTYKHQLFIFDAGQKASLESVLVVVHRLENSTEIAYVIVETTATVSQQYTATRIKKCHRCFPKIRCCHHDTVFTPRGDTPQELGIIVDKMKAEQFKWVSSHLPKGDGAFRSWASTPQHLTLATSTKSNLDVQLCKFVADEARRLNDTLNDPSLDIAFSSFSSSLRGMQIGGLPKDVLPQFLKSLGQENNLNDWDVVLLQVSLEQMNGVVIYEQVLYTSNNTDSSVGQFFWLMARKRDGALDFDIVKATISASYNFSGTRHASMESLEPTANPKEAPRRYSILESDTTNGKVDPIVYENFYNALKLMSFRYVLAGSCQASSRLLADDPPTPTPTPTPSPSPTPDPTGGWLPYVNQLASAVSAVAAAWKDFASAIQTKTTQTICDIERLGFTHYMHDTTYLKVIGLPAHIIPQFMDALISKYKLPLSPLELISFNYATNNVTWEETSLLWQDAGAGNSNFFSLKKALNPADNSMSFILSYMKAQFSLAPALRVVTTDKSYLGGIFQSHKTKIQEIPPTLSLNDVMVLTQYFRVVAFSLMADDLGVKFEWPTVPPENKRCY